MEISSSASTIAAAPAARAAAAPWIALAIVVAYFFAVALLAPTTPYGDDVGIAKEAAAFGAAKSLQEAWTILSAQHDEHRPIVARLVFWAADALPGPTGYRLIALTGSLFLLLAFWLFAREARRIAAPAAVLVALAALVFNFGASEASLWASAAVSNFGVLAMAMAMLALLNAGGVWAVLAIVPALLAVGMQGNGLAALPVGIGFLLVNRSWTLAAMWALVLAGVAAWYFTGYVRPLDAPNPARLTSRLPELMIYALAFCGSAVAFGGESLGALNLLFVGVAATVGAGLVLATTWGVLRGGLSSDGRWLLWLNAFVIFTAMLAGLSRIDHGVAQALTPRYHVNSCVMIAATLLYLLQEDGPFADMLHRQAGALAAVGVVYVLATTPILMWMHNLHSGDAPAPAASGGAPTPDPRWDLDRAALAEPFDS
jgi:hypothetical protein